MNDYAKVLFGANAVHVPMWMYVQHQGDGVVSFVGSSRVPTGDNPLRFGSSRSHQFVLGEQLIRPHLVVATDELRGSGLSALAIGDHNVPQMLLDGEVLIDMGGGFGAAQTSGWRS